MEVYGVKYVFEEITLEDLIEFKKYKKERGEMEADEETWESISFTIARKLIEPRMTVEEVKKLPIKIVLELNRRIMEKSGFSVRQTPTALLAETR